MWCAKWRIKLNPVKTKVIIFSMSTLTRKTELNLKLYGETLKIYHQVKFLGITFDSQLNFKKHFEDILNRCNTRYHRLRLLVNKKWATLIQIYKQCVHPIFEYGSVSTITASDNIISKIQRLQNKFILLAFRLLKYICSKLLHDSSGLPYVKDRLLSCATKSLDRIAQRVNIFPPAQPCLGPFPNAIICGPSCELLDYHDLLRWPPIPITVWNRQSGLYADTLRHRLRTLKSKPPHIALAVWTLVWTQRYGHRKLTPLFHPHSQVKFVLTHLLTVLIKACLPPQQLLGKQMC